MSYKCDITYRLSNISIDGGGGAGKSTLSRKMKGAARTANIVQMDDFYHLSSDRTEPTSEQIGGNWDWQRLKKQVLDPLNANKPSKYQRYDWDSDQLAEWHHIECGGIVIIEGCYSLRNELNDYYDLRIWVESPKDLRLKRGIERDGEEKRHLWEDMWMPDEEKYILTQNPLNKVDLILDGTGNLQKDTTYEVKLIEAKGSFAWVEKL